MDDRRNLITPLRLVLALMVLVSHCWPLTLGSDAREPLYAVARGMTLGNIAVDGFFVLSGYLVTASWQRRPGSAYLRARFLRIYPGYAVAMAVAIVAALIWGRGALTAPAVIKSALLVPVSIPATFGSPAAFSHTVNGSLWTIPIEFACYLMLAVILATLGRRGWIGMAFLLVGSVALAAQAALVQPGNWVSLPEFGASFASGSLLRLLALRWVERPRWGLVAGAFSAWILLLVLRPTILWPLDGPLLSYPLLSVALTRVAYAPRSDYSYGVYLYAWPVQQVLVTLLHLTQPLALLALTLPCVLPLAFSSWHLVEAPALRLNRQTMPRRSTLAAVATAVRG